MSKGEEYIASHSFVLEGIEVRLRPWQTLPQSVTVYMNKGLPPLPHSPQEQKLQGEDYSRASKIRGFTLENDTISKEGESADEMPRPELQGKSSFFPATFRQAVTSPPKIPMSKSAQKIPQLTGHETRYARLFTEEQSGFIELVQGSSCSASRYSHGNDEQWWPTYPHRYPASSSVREKGDNGKYDQAKFMNIDGEKNITLSAPLQLTEVPFSAGEALLLPSFRNSPIRTHSTEPVTLGGFIQETQSGSGLDHEVYLPYSHGMTSSNTLHLVPAPLVLRQKPRENTSSQGSGLSSLLGKSFFWRRTVYSMSFEGLDMSLIYALRKTLSYS